MLVLSVRVFLATLLTQCLLCRAVSVELDSYEPGQAIHPLSYIVWFF